MRGDDVQQVGGWGELDHVIYFDGHDVGDCLDDGEECSMSASGQRAAYLQAGGGGRVRREEEVQGGRSRETRKGSKTEAGAESLLA